MFLQLIQWQFNSPQAKPYLLSSIVNPVYELPHELQNNLRLTILGKLEMERKSQNWE